MKNQDAVCPTWRDKMFCDASRCRLGMYLLGFAMLFMGGCFSFSSRLDPAPPYEKIEGGEYAISRECYLYKRANDGADTTLILDDESFVLHAKPEEQVVRVDSVARGRSVKVVKVHKELFRGMVFFYVDLLVDRNGIQTKCVFYPSSNRGLYPLRDERVRDPLWGSLSDR